MRVIVIILFLLDNGHGAENLQKVCFYLARLYIDDVLTINNSDIENNQGQLQVCCLNWVKDTTEKDGSTSYIIICTSQMGWSTSRFLSQQ